jgi:hypothetical protein
MKKFHIIIDQQFYGNPSNKRIVDYIDRNSQNSNKWNLRWATESENEVDFHGQNNEAIPH